MNLKTNSSRVEKWINKIHLGTCLDIIKQMPDKSINAVITSPPYWQLRDYGFPEQWGLEPTFQEYLEHLWSLMDEIWRVLKDDGTVFINLGDTYNTKSGNMVQKDYSNTINSCMNNAIIDKNNYTKSKTIPNKSLCLIPHRFAIGCSDRGWIIRNDIKWLKPNAMPESVTDRFSKKSEYIFFMVKNQKYYFDLDSIRDKQKQVSIERSQRGISENNKWIDGPDGQSPHSLSQPRPNKTTKIPKDQAEMFGSPRARNHRKNSVRDIALNIEGDKNLRGRDTEIGKNPGDVTHFWNVSEDWEISTTPSSKKHYATFNNELIEKPIVAGTPKHVCPKCGKGF